MVIVGENQINMAEELLKTVKEIQTSNRFILKRLNGLFHSSDGHCSWNIENSPASLNAYTTCVDKVFYCLMKMYRWRNFQMTKTEKSSEKQEQYLKDIKRLETKVRELEQVVKEKDKVQSELEKQFKHMEEKIDSLEISLMAVQTDDSKLRSASLRKEQAVFKQDQFLTERVEQKSTTSVTDKPAPERRETIRQTSQTEKLKNSVPPSELTDSGEARSSPSEIKEQPTEKNNQDTVIIKQDTTERSSDKSETGLKGKEWKELAEGTGHSDSDKTYQEKEASASSQSAYQEENRSKKTVEIINQPVRKSHGTEQYWRYLAQKELEAGKRTLKDLEGVHTVICLDISASMTEHDAWREALAFLQDYLNGLQDLSTQHGIANEHVALVTFGHETSVQKRLTNNYCEIRQLVESQKLGGPSPLYGGLVLGLAAAGSSEHIFEVVNNAQVFTKVIIITDGSLTEVGQYAGPDFPVEDLGETKAKLVQCMEEYKNSHLDTYCVPVGKYDKETSEFLDLMLAVAEGRKLNIRSGRQFARRTYLTTKIRDPLGILVSPFTLGVSEFSDFSAEDKEMIEEIKSDARKNFFSRLGGDSNQKKYRELEGGNFPPIGSRVRRGPDWKWNNQDSNGPGTVIGHDDGEQVWVEWDEDEHRNVYRYGQPGLDVLIVDEPRKLKFGQKLAVGSVVKPGKDWNHSASKGQYWQRGVVIRLDQNKAHVRWENGERGDYSYGDTGTCEIEICTGFLAFGSEGHVLGSGITTAPPEKKTKNKNKNVHR